MYTVNSMQMSSGNVSALPTVSIKIPLSECSNSSTSLGLLPNSYQTNNHWEILFIIPLTTDFQLRNHLSKIQSSEKWHEWGYTRLNWKHATMTIVHDIGRNELHPWNIHSGITFTPGSYTTSKLSYNGSFVGSNQLKRPMTILFDSFEILHCEVYALVTRLEDEAVIYTCLYATQKEVRLQFFKSENN